jgi:hypothetical protein
MTFKAIINQQFKKILIVKTYAELLLDKNDKSSKVKNDKKRPFEKDIKNK